MASVLGESAARHLPMDGVARVPAVRIVDATVEIPLRGVSNAYGVTGDSRIYRHGRQLVLRALSGISLEIGRGERVGILGANGSGKTTLLRLIAGMLPASSGEVVVTGTVNAVIAAGAGIVPSLSGRRNAELRHALLAVRSLSVDDYVADVEAFAELGAFFNLPIGTYSPGMLSRLQFAMSTIVPADILILDEWLGVADRSFQEKAHHRLMSLIDRSEGFLLASHDDHLLRTMTHRVITLTRGRILSEPHD
ncbi:ABC transporter ATP-binding protein [Bradyrhizobium diazoefficiens]|nr:ABC transporter ATP-binding protein [Bradyrhizobium diazoefficiens]MBR0774574.1 ABC transporter ATP-binding protein [Bradyrhizobium diazoefficiens]